VHERHNFNGSDELAVLTVTSVAGNVSDKQLAAKYKRAMAAGRCERLLVSRMEMERLRIRRATDLGTDVGLVLEPGNRLHHGDVLSADGKFIVVEQLPEKVASIHLKKAGAEKMAGLAALIGHAIGNRHRPIAVHNGTISFPLQAESEADTFRRILPAEVKIKITEEVFVPSGDAHAHE
jgi:urease accessory protein